MADRELRRMSRTELIEIIYALQQNERSLRAEIDSLTIEVRDRMIRKEEAGSIAEAALSLNQIFESAQAAADQYVEAIKVNDGESVARAAGILADAEEQAKKIRTAAKQEAKDIVDSARDEAKKILVLFGSEEEVFDRSESEEKVPKQGALKEESFERDESKEEMVGRAESEEKILNQNESEEAISDREDSEEAGLGKEKDEQKRDSDAFS